MYYSNLAEKATSWKAEAEIILASLDSEELGAMNALIEMFPKVFCICSYSHGVFLKEIASSPFQLFIPTQINPTTIFSAFETIRQASGGNKVELVSDMLLASDANKEQQNGEMNGINEKNKLVLRTFCSFFPPSFPLFFTNLQALCYWLVVLCYLQDSISSRNLTRISVKVLTASALVSAISRSLLPSRLLFTGMHAFQLLICTLQTHILCCIFSFFKRF